jgi:hypothetical protein
MDGEALTNGGWFTRWPYRSYGLVRCDRHVKPNSGAPPVLVAFGDYDAMRLRQFAAEHGGALVDGWKLFGAASLFSEAAE